VMDREQPFAVFSGMLSGHSAPFVGSPNLLAGSIDTSTSPAWLLFGWDHGIADFSGSYDVSGNPEHGDRGF
jgi:hypothetical protein